MLWASSSLVTEKGHFVAYTVDHIRFMMPLSYLHNWILQELFRMSEEEFGLPSEGPIILPCDAAFMESVVSLIQRGSGEDMEKALLSSVSSTRCIASDRELLGQNMFVRSY